MLRKLLPIIACFLAALVIFPAAAKTVHELTHDHEERCHVDGAHFCQHEHACSVCDYTLSPSFAAQFVSFELLSAKEALHIPVFPYSSDHTNHTGFSFSLRGPPIC